MAALTRLGIAKPAAAAFGSGTSVFTAIKPTLLSVIATNTQGSNGSASIYVVPSGVTNPDNYGLITYNLTISGYNTYETFRFAISAGDSVHVAGTEGIAYYVQGIAQEEA